MKISTELRVFCLGAVLLIIAGTIQRVTSYEEIDDLEGDDDSGGGGGPPKKFRCTQVGSKLNCKLKGTEDWMEEQEGESSDDADDTLSKRYPHLHTTTTRSSTRYKHHSTHVPIVGNCTDRKKPGPCSKWVTRWYFNPEVGECEEFKWGGCKANKNNFKNIQECQRICPNCRQPLDAVLVSPNQSPSVKVPVCPGIKRNLTVTFQLNQYPLDLYLLMDYTGTMINARNSLAALSDELIRVVGSVSPDYTIGFGTHIDKPWGRNARPEYYSFRNEWPLSSNSTGMGTAVRKVPTQGSGRAESQLEALAQVGACTKEIRWRPQARHIVVLLTDEQFHQAGDCGSDSGCKGSLPYDGECSLDSNGYYTKVDTHDHPSQAQAINALNDNKIAVIFLIVDTPNKPKTTSNIRQKYDNLVAKLNNVEIDDLKNTNDVVNLIKRAYDKMQSYVKLESSKTNDIGLNIKYYTTCNKGDLTETSLCKNIGNSGKVTFTLELELAVCPPSGIITQKVKINPTGVNTGIEINVELYC